MGERRGVYKVFVGNLRPKRSEEDTIKINLEKTGWDGMEWTDLALDSDRWWAVVNAVMNL